MIRVGGANVADIRVGNHPIREVRIGGELVWSSETPDHLTFTAIKNDSSVSLKVSSQTSASFLISVDCGKNWRKYSNGEVISLPSSGDCVKFKADEGGNDYITSPDGSAYSHFVMTGKVSASGNVNSLLNSNTRRVSRLTPRAFYKLFSECDSLVTAPDLPCMCLAENCYYGMFSKCSSLTEAPHLPAEVMAKSCYNYMFAYCSSLESAPALNSVQLADSCYNQMFTMCENLARAPVLPAEELFERCYRFLFYGCPKIDDVSIGYSGAFDIHHTSGDFDKASFHGWLTDVNPTGTLHYNGVDRTAGGSAVPNGWTVVPYV